MGTRMDCTGFGRINILQDTEEFCYGVDAVLLADFAADGAASQRVMDLGTGTGIIPLLLSHKTEAPYIGGIEVQEHSYQLALQNREINGLRERLHFFCENVRDFPGEGYEEYRESFDLVTTNPPYMQGNCGLIGKNRAKTIARHEILGELRDFIRCAAALLKDRGEFCMVHRPFRLADIFETCRSYRLEPKALRFISGKPMEKPNLLLLRCSKNGNRELRIERPLAVHNEDGTYSEEILKMYEKSLKTVAIKK